MTPPLRLHGAGAQALTEGKLRPETHKIILLVIPAPIFCNAETVDDMRDDECEAVDGGISYRLCLSRAYG